MRIPLAGALRRATVVTAALATAVALAACGGGSDTTSGDGGGDWETVTIEHKFGTTRITERPRRVLTVGFNEEDFALALGVVPVGAREFLGYDAPQRPWAQRALGGRTVPTVGANEIDFEKVAELRPDLILGINSYVDAKGYATLSKIAPTVAQSDDHADGATPWQEQTRLTGRALGNADAAEQVVDGVEDRFGDAKKAYPDFVGKSAAFGLGVGATGTYSIGRDDYRSGWLTDLGFTVPEKGGDVALEQFDTLDADVLVLEGVEGDVLSQPVVQRLAVVREKRTVDLGQFDQDFAGALGFNSPLSLPTVLDIALPRLAAATDGDPATVPEPYTG